VPPNSCLRSFAFSSWQESISLYTPTLHQQKAEGEDQRRKRRKQNVYQLIGHGSIKLCQNFASTSALCNQLRVHPIVKLASCKFEKIKYGANEYQNYQQAFFLFQFLWRISCTLKQKAEKLLDGSTLRVKKKGRKALRMGLP
jgi:hypothetical protein